MCEKVARVVRDYEEERERERMGGWEWVLYVVDGEWKEALVASRAGGIGRGMYPRRFCCAGGFYAELRRGLIDCARVSSVENKRHSLDGFHWPAVGTATSPEKLIPLCIANLATCERRWRPCGQDDQVHNQPSNSSLFSWPNTVNE